MNTVLVIGAVWPEPNSTAAGSRMLQLLDFFLNKSYQVVFACAAAKNKETAFLEEKNIETVSIKLNHSEFDIFLENLNPDIVIFDRFIIEEQFGWRVHQICTDALKILDTEDLHFLRKYRQLKLNKKTHINFKQLEITKREIASIYRCDLSLIISEEEMNLLKTEFSIPDKLLFYLPFLVEQYPSFKYELLPSFQDRKDFICLGNFRHKPNNDAVRYLKEEVWPLIHQKLPQVNIHIFGAYANAGDKQLQDENMNFYVKGYVEDIHKEMSKARVQLAPLRFGAGLKGKFITGILASTPSVTTRVGAEGFNGEFDWNGDIENDPSAFAAAAIELYTNNQKWNVAQQNGMQILKNRFNKSYFYPLLEERIATSIENHHSLRNDNFIGAMLLHHRNKSTFYLSKYIETKNMLENYQKK